MKKNQENNNSNNIGLDTHMEFKRLVNENIPADQADAIIQVIKQIVIGSMATKADIDNIGFKIKSLSSDINDFNEENKNQSKAILSDYSRKFEERSSSNEHRISLKLEAFEEELLTTEKKVKEIVEAIITKISRLQTSLADRSELFKNIEESENRLSLEITELKKISSGRKRFLQTILPTLTITNLLFLIFITYKLFYDK